MLWLSSATDPQDFRGYIEDVDYRTLARPMREASLIETVLQPIRDLPAWPVTLSRCTKYHRR